MWPETFCKYNERLLYLKKNVILYKCSQKQKKESNKKQVKVKEEIQQNIFYINNQRVTKKKKKKNEKLLLIYFLIIFANILCPGTNIRTKKFNSYTYFHLGTINHAQFLSNYSSGIIGITWNTLDTPKGSKDCSHERSC